MGAVGVVGAEGSRRARGVWWVRCMVGGRYRPNGKLCSRTSASFIAADAGSVTGAAALSRAAMESPTTRSNAALFTSTASLMIALFELAVAYS